MGKPPIYFTKLLNKINENLNALESEIHSQETHQPPGVGEHCSLAGSPESYV